MKQYNFDENNINWHKLEDFDNFVFSILDVDLANRIVDVIFKFEANKQIFLHRHLALNKIFVIQGELNLYEPNGKLKESRKAGTYTTSPADVNPHRECGGDEGAVVLFSIRGADGMLYEVLDEDQHVVGGISMRDVIELHKAQIA